MSNFFQENIDKRPGAAEVNKWKSFATWSSKEKVEIEFQSDICCRSTIPPLNRDNTRWYFSRWRKTLKSKIDNLRIWKICCNFRANKNVIRRHLNSPLFLHSLLSFGCPRHVICVKNISQWMEFLNTKIDLLCRYCSLNFVGDKEKVVQGYENVTWSVDSVAFPETPMSYFYSAKSATAKWN